MSFDMYYSRMGNNQYTKMPTQIPRMPFCDLMDKFYSQISKDFEGKSNMPIEAPFCPLEKVFISVFCSF